MTGSVTADESVIFASAKETVSASLSLTASIGQTFTTTYGPIASGLYGHMQFVAWSDSFTWQKYQSTATCGATLLGSGTFNTPITDDFGYHTWSDSSSTS